MTATSEGVNPSLAEYGRNKLAKRTRQVGSEVLMDSRCG